MIRGIYENFAPPWGVQGGAQRAGLGALSFIIMNELHNF